MLWLLFFLLPVLVGLSFIVIDRQPPGVFAEDDDT
jgi:hypothetical protein